MSAGQGPVVYWIAAARQIDGMAELAALRLWPRRFASLAASTVPNKVSRTGCVPGKFENTAFKP